MSRTLLLARTLFARFFESELLPPGLPQAQLVIWSMAILAAPTLLMPVRMAGKYALLESNPPLLARALFADRLIFLTISMTCMGLVALVLWQNVFPDRRDARLLGVLPLSSRLLVTARLLALSALAGIFLAGLNLVPTVIYGPIVGYYGGASTVLLGPIAHLLATAGAGAFVFFSLVAVQSVWLNVGGRSAERLALVLQASFLIALLQQLFFFFRLMGLVGSDLSRIADDPLLRNIPVFWFLGLYDVLGGRPAPGSVTLALRAMVATTSVIATTFAMLAFTHARLLRLALEGRPPGRHGGAPRAILTPIMTLWRQGSAERATFAFTVRTLSRSRSHRMLLAIYLGLAVAMIAATLGPLALRRGLLAFLTPSVPVLAAPLVLMFFSLMGASVMMAIPVEPKANWVFRLLEPGDRVAALNGVRDALLATIVVPVAALGAGSAVVLWNVRAALVHGLVCAVMGWLLCEALLLRVRKIPFTCTYFPGGSRVRMWPFYLFVFSNYCFTTAAIELSLIDHARGAAVFLIVLVAIGAGLVRLRTRSLVAPPGLRFEEIDPDALFEGFSLSEGLAARAPAPARVVPAALRGHRG